LKGVAILKKEIDDALLIQKAVAILEEYQIVLPEEQQTGIFVDEYLMIMRESFDRLYKSEVKYGETNTLISLYDEVLIFQSVIGSADNHFLAGIASKAAVLQSAADDLYEKVNADVALPGFSGTKEDAIDLFCEFLNNTNGFCTFKFDSGFDLKLPGYQEHAVLKAPRIYTITMTVLSHTMTLFLVYGSSYNFEKVVL